MNKKLRIIIVLAIIAIIICAAIICSKQLKNRKNIDEKASPIVAENATNFKVLDITCENGDEAEIKIELTNDSNFVAANFEFEYDEDYLEYIGYEVGKPFEVGAMTMVNESKDGKVLIAFVDDPENKDGIKAGNIITLRFNTKKNTDKEGLNTSFKCTTLKQADGENVEFNINQGKIIIK